MDELSDRVIYIGNVAAEIDEPSLLAIFSNCGPVTEIRLAGKPGYNTVFCFVEYADPSQAATALAMDGMNLGGRQIKVSMAKASSVAKMGDNRGRGRDNSIPPPRQLQAQAQARLQGQGFQPPPQYARPPPMQAPVQNYGPPPGYEPHHYPPHYAPAPSYPPPPRPGHHMQGPPMHSPGPPKSLPPPNMGPTMAPLPHMQYPPDFGQGYGVPAPTPSGGGRSRRPHQDPEKVERTIYVENLAEGLSEQVLADYFADCGKVTSVRMARGGLGPVRAWLEFESPDSIFSAKEHDGTKMGDSVIRVTQSKTAIHTNGLLKHGNNSGTPPPEGNAAASGGQAEATS